MIGDLEKLLERLNSKSDWAVVGAAGLFGFVADAAINIVPLPIFSPGTCGLTAAGIALTAKRGWESVIEENQKEKQLRLYLKEASHLIREAEEILEFKIKNFTVELKILLEQFDIKNTNYQDYDLLDRAVQNLRNGKINSNTKKTLYEFFPQMKQNLKKPVDELVDESKFISELRFNLMSAEAEHNVEAIKHLIDKARRL
jgi:hypothetical protein